MAKTSRRGAYASPSTWTEPSRGLSSSYRAESETPAAGEDHRVEPADGLLAQRVDVADHDLGAADRDDLLHEPHPHALGVEPAEDAADDVAARAAEPGRRWRRSRTTSWPWLGQQVGDRQRRHVVVLRDDEHARPRRCARPASTSRMSTTRGPSAPGICGTPRQSHPSPRPRRRAPAPRPRRAVAR